MKREGDSHKIRKIIWSIDPFEGTTKIQKKAAETIRSLLRLKDISVGIEPVYVVPPNYATSAEFYYSPEFDVEGQALLALKQRLKNVTIPDLQLPRVLGEPSATTTGAVKVLIDYAVQSHADLIVVGTHARHGVSRLFLGSFAEALILHSPVPVLTVSAVTKPIRKIDNILFPTDFGEESKLVFPRVLELAKELRAKITILHAIFKPMRASGSRWVSLRKEYMLQEKETGQRQAQYYLDLAQESGVVARTETIVSSDAVSEVVERYTARHEFQLITMASRSGKFSSALTGSVTRQVVRGSRLPVWILREKTLRLAIERGEIGRRRVAAA